MITVQFVLGAILGAALSSQTGIAFVAMWFVGHVRKASHRWLISAAWVTVWNVGWWNYIESLQEIGFDPTGRIVVSVLVGFPIAGGLAAWRAKYVGLPKRAEYKEVQS